MSDELGPDNAPETCAHTGGFTMETRTACLEKPHDPSIKWVFELSLCCVECGEDFEFVGVPEGIAVATPTVSTDKLEIHLPIRPKRRVVRLEIVKTV